MPCWCLVLSGVWHFFHAWFNSHNRVMSLWLVLMPRVHFNKTHTIVQPWRVEAHISPWHTALCSHNSLISNCFTPDRWVHKFLHAANINTNNNNRCFKNEGLPWECEHHVAPERWPVVACSHAVCGFVSCGFWVNHAQQLFTWNHDNDSDVKKKNQ